jgi:hypothetical protein
MRSAIARKPVAFDNAGETSPLSDTGHIDPLTFLENVYSQRFPLDEHLFSHRLEFAQVANGGGIVFAEVSELRLIRPFGLR